MSKFDWDTAYDKAGREVGSGIVRAFFVAVLFIAAVVVLVLTVMGIRSAVTGESFECQLYRHVPGACVSDR